MTLFDEVVAFVNDAFGGKNIKHFERTVFWYDRFLPGLSEAHKIGSGEL
jgi:hypothetical protein